MVCVILAWPLTGIPVPISPFALAAGALLAYEGITRPVIRWSLVLLTACELFYGMGVGILSLPFMASVILLATVGRWASITPLMRETGWSPIVLVRAALNGLILAFVMGAVQALMQSAMLGGSLLRERILANMGTAASIGGAYIIIFCLLVILHRIDVPFRRQIMYGI
jgi:hypothetical protein